MGVNAKLQVIIDKLDTMQTTLDAIASAVGAPPTPPEHSFDDLYELISNIHEDTMSMDGKLLSIRNYIKDPSEDAIDDDYKSLMWNIYILRRNMVSPALVPSPTTPPVQSLLIDMWNAWTTIFTDIRSHTNNTRNYLFYGLNNLGLTVTGNSYDYPQSSYLFYSLEWLGLISGALGRPIEANNRDIIVLLALLLDRWTTGDVQGGLYPPDLCNDPYVSSGMVLAPTGITQILESTLWAEFPDPPPAGISFGSTFGLGLDTDHYELISSTGDWNSWKVYVASSASNFGIYIGTDIDLSLHRYPTNVWYDLSGLNTHLSFFVGGSEGIRVFMCQNWGPGSGSGGPWGGGSSGGGTYWGDCTEIASEQGTLTYVSLSQTHTRYYTPLSSLSIGLVQSFEIGGNQYIYDVEDAATSMNWNGVKVTLLSGDLARVWWVRANGTAEVHYINTIGESFVVNEDTTIAGIDNWTSNSISPGDPYTVEVCPVTVDP